MHVCTPTSQRDLDPTWCQGGHPFQTSIQMSLFPFQSINIKTSFRVSCPWPKKSIDCYHLIEIGAELLAILVFRLEVYICRWLYSVELRLCGYALHKTPAKCINKSDVSTLCIPCITIQAQRSPACSNQTLTLFRSSEQ